MRWYPFFTLFTALMFVCLSVEGQIQVDARIDSTSLLIGDQRTYQLEIVHTSDLKVQAIDFSALEAEPKIEIITEETLDTVYNKEEVVLRKRLILTSFDSGYHWIPRIPILYAYKGQAGEIKTNRVPIAVRTLPIASDSLALQPIKNIIEEPLKFQDVIPYLAGGVLVLALLYLGWFFFLRKKEEQKLPEEVQDNRLAHVIALEKLEKLNAEKKWQSGDIKGFHTELTYIFREYLERRFKIRALESTSDEIMVGIKYQTVKEIEAKWYNELLRLLQLADLVKFAQAEPPIETHQEMFEMTERFIRETKKEEDILEDQSTEN